MSNVNVLIMKKIVMNKILYAVLAAFCLVSCFDDEGNYDYKFLNPPTWLINTATTPIYVYCRVGEDAVFKGGDKLTWSGADSTERWNTVRYEWIFKNVKGEEVVVGEDLDLVLPTQEVLDKLGYQGVPASALSGQFAVIDKETEVRWMAEVYLSISSAYAAYDWFVLSENGGKAKMSAIRRKSETQNGKKVVQWILQDNVYEKINGHEIPGKPIDLVFAKAKNIGTEGSATVITDQVAYELDNESMVKVGEIKDQFQNGTPAGFNMVARRDITPISDGAPFTFVATKDGQVYSRKMSKNWLGGDFLSEPYYIDTLDYDITYFGHSRYGSMFPCYDKKNRRVMMAISFVNYVGGMENQTAVNKMKIIPLEDIGGGGIPVWGFPKGTNVVHLSENNHMPGFKGSYLNCTYTAIVEYNGQYFIGDFVVNSQFFKLQKNDAAAARYFYLEGPVKDSKYLLSANLRTGRNYNSPAHDFFSVDNKLYYLQRDLLSMFEMQPPKQELAVQIDSKITFLTYDWNDCGMLVIGCEDGSLYGYDIKHIEAPQLVFKLNVGGKVVAAKQLGYKSITASHDYY